MLNVDFFKSSLYNTAIILLSLFMLFGHKMSEMAQKTQILLTHYLDSGLLFWNSNLYTRKMCTIA